MELYLLGTFYAVGVNGEELSFRSNRERALLAYLAVETDQKHRRDAIATLFWPEVDETQARNNLRVTLHRLRQTIGQENEKAEFLQVSRNELEIVPDDSIFIDVKTLVDVINKTNKHEHTERHHCQLCIEELEGVVDYYQGEFLKGFSLEDSQMFSEWVLLRQQRLHGQILRTLHDLTAYHLAGRNLSLARHFANRQLELEPWREEAHRQLMSILAIGGERTAAISQYEICCALLEKELGVGASYETIALYEQIRRGESIEAASAPLSAQLSENTAILAEDELVPGPPQSAAKRSYLPRTNLIAAVISISLLVVLGWSMWNFYFDRLTIYDDFNESTTDGVPDATRWKFPHNGPGPSCNFAQQDGVLKFIPAANLGSGDCALRLAPPEFVQGKELGSMSARMRLVNSPEEGALAVGLRVSSSFQNGDWNLDCAIVSEVGSTTFEMVISDTRIDQILYSSRREINPEAWYDIQLVINNETMALSCLIDGVEIGKFEPDFPASLLSASFVREILVQNASANSSEIWFDDFRIKEDR